jgi:peptidoglycan/LPS O-acetylase OafA/YrhL
MDWINPVYWTLAIEVQFYLLIGLTFPLWVRCSSRTFLVGTALLSIAGLWIEPSYVLCYWPLFAMGIAVLRLHHALDRPSWSLAVMAMAGALLAYGHGLAVALAGVVSAAAIHFGPSLLCARPLVWLGTISFSLYLLHVPVGGRVVNLLTRLGDSELFRLSTSAAALLVSIGSAYFFWRLVERPATHWASKVLLAAKPRSEGMTAAPDQPPNAQS